ncbi:MAG: hypothetical protein AB1726_04835 [Planctomycetota bacterium]
MEEVLSLPRRSPAVLLALLGAISPLLSRASAPPPVAAGGSSSDPFAPGLRWSFAAPPSAPWIPRAVALVGDGELCWVAPAGGTPSLALFAAAEIRDPDLPLFADPGLSGAIGPIQVAAGDDPGELFALVQLPGPVSPLRRTIATCHDAVAAAGGAAFAPCWSHEVGVPGNGPALLATDAGGGVLVAAAFDAGSRRVRLESLDPRTGALLAAAELPAPALRNLAVAAAGPCAVVLAGDRAVVLDLALATLHSTALAAAGAGLALSADGTRIAVGDGGEVFLLERAGGAWSRRTLLAGGLDELAVGVALSAAGDVLAATWWNGATGADVRCMIVDAATGTPRAGWAQAGAAGSLQNFPSALAITPDGSRVAVGLWGAGDGRPEVVLLDATTGATLLAADLPGSALALALDPGGTRVAVAMKDTHANLFSTTGAVRLYDTGERDLQLTRGLVVGGRLELALAGPPATAAIFAAGTPLVDPLPLALLGGDLWIDLACPILLLPVPPGPDGRAGAGADLPADPALAGLPVAVQAAALLLGGGIELAERVVRVRVL